MRQQHLFATRGDIAEFRHCEVRWEGLIMFSRQTITVFWRKIGDAIVPPLFVWTRSTSPVWNQDAYLFLVCIDNIYGLHLKGQTHIDSKFVHKVLYQNGLWHGNSCLIVWYFTFAKKTDPRYICTKNPREYILEPHYLFSYFSIF